jgi:carbonic anhydrase/acetyltransferase-like protein (isoleucine patch superfamily)
VDLNDRGLGDCATIIGDRVTVGHGAILHGCKIGDACLIGMGATVLSGASVGAGSVVAAGALVREGQQIPERSMVMGMPAEVKRQLPEEAVEKIRASARHYVELAEEYKQNKKTENPEKNVYIIKSCLLLSILARYSYFDTSDLYIH